VEPNLIALHGVKGAGKDTTYHFITEWCERFEPAFSAVRGGFADKAKWAYMRQWVPDCTLEWACQFVDEHKNDPDVLAVMETKANPSRHIAAVVFRTHLAQFASEGARSIYGEDFWVDQLLPSQGWQYNFLTDPADDEDSFQFRRANFAVITDMRFENELYRVRELGGLNVKLRRYSAEQAVVQEAKQQGRDIHISELGIPDEMFDVVITNNDDDIDEAGRRTKLVMDEVARNGIESIKEGRPIPWRIGV
jgi:hypothetical protein